jgi:hypothetical protein
MVKIEAYKPGTLVRVRDKSLLPGAECYTSNVNLVATHGYLYVVVSVEPFPDFDADEQEIDSHTYLCRSLATGNDEVPWYHDEIEGAEE